jgi:flagellar biosynthesis protein FlhB
MSDESGEKTEEPTQKKIDDARKRGQIWKSRDLTGVCVFLVGFGALKFSWPYVQGEITKLFHLAFEELARPALRRETIVAFIYHGVLSTLFLSLPVMGACMIIGIVVEFLQVGPLLSMQVIQPKLEKLDFISGMKNLVSKKQIVELLKGTMKMSLASYVVYGVIRDAIRMVMLSVRAEPDVALKILGDLVYTMSVRIGLLFMLFGIFDVWFQRRSYLKDLMMTKDEVKREYKESEGDPHHKAKRKEFHQEIVEGAMMENVKNADVVVTNPDHVAVALRYDVHADGAPRVLWKATDAEAEALKAAARERGISILRNVPLARALLDVEVGTEVPEAVYDAVAEVLNFVYSLEQRSLKAV